MKAQRIGYVLKKYPRFSETFIVNEILELERQGVSVTIFSLYTPNEGRFHRKLSEVKAEVVYLPDLNPVGLFRWIYDRRERWSERGALPANALWESIVKDEKRASREFAKGLALAHEIEERGLDHLHAHFATSAARVARLAGSLTRTPFSFTAHAKDLYHESVCPDELGELLRDASFAVTVCDSNLSFLESRYALSTPVHRIYNGLDLTHWQPVVDRIMRRNRFQILGVGRLIPKKGFDTLIESCAILARNGFAFECQIAGDGADRGSLETLVRDRGLEGQVRLLGPQPDVSVRELMKNADVFALPCRVASDGNRDALPTVLLEALATGLPCVSTPVVGIPEILDNGRAGILVSPDAPTELADALARLQGDMELRQSLSNSGRKRVEDRFDVQRNVATLRDFMVRDTRDKSASDGARTSVEAAS